MVNEDLKNALQQKIKEKRFSRLSDHGRTAYETKGELKKQEQDEIARKKLEEENEKKERKRKKEREKKKRQKERRKREESEISQKLENEES